MKNYTITVNGNIYDVSVEEKENINEIPQVKNRAVSQSQSTVASVQHTNMEKKTASDQSKESSEIQGSYKIEAGAGGKVISVNIQSGDEVKPGDTIFILEIMKMETPVTAQQAGKIISVHTTIGDIVKTGDILATMN